MSDLWNEQPAHLVRPVAIRRDLAHDLLLVEKVGLAVVAQIKAAPPYDQDSEDDCPPRGIERPALGSFSTVWDDAS